MMFVVALMSRIWFKQDSAMRHEANIHISRLVLSVFAVRRYCLRRYSCALSA